MFNHPRILMAEADAAAGAAAPVATAPAEAPTTEPQAQAAPALTRDDVKSMLSEFRNGLFADFRKAGGFEKPSKTKTDDAPSVPTAPQLDPIKLRALDRSLTKAGLATELSQTQYERVERAFALETPDDVDGWVKDYFPAPKASPPAAAPAAATTVAKPTPQNAQPASDRGAPAATVPLIERDLVTMSESDRNALIKEKGYGWYSKQLAGQLKGRPIQLR